MGVHGLWKLLEPTGKPVPLESLENKVLAVDVSIWLYQVTKGIQTTGGGAVPNAHLLGLFNRICKLLYYRIKPVFVFDGGVPLLKKETIEARKRQKRKAQDNSEQLREKLLENFLRQKAVNQLLGNENVPTTSQAVDDMYALPPLPEQEESDESDSDTEVTTAKIESFCDFQYGKDLHSIDINSEQFKLLPPDVRHEILSELMETRKQNSWARIHEMPEKSQDFSKFQLERLKKRRDVQVSLDTAAKEMGGRTMTFSELEAMFKEDGIVTDSLRGQRIVGDNVTRFVYVTGKSKEKEKEKPVENKSEPVTKVDRTPVKPKTSPISESEFQRNLQVIEEILFVNDSSSDEELNDKNDTEYVQSLLKEEKISQEEILKIIKQEQKMDEESNPNIIESESNISESVILPEKSDDVEIIECSQVEKYKLSTLIDQIAETSEKTEVSQSEKSPLTVEENQSAKSSVELFADNDSNAGLTDSQISTASQSDLVKTVILRDDDEPIFEAQSVELFSESDSDDFIEVTDENEKSSCVRESEKAIEICIDPNKSIIDDIFSDIFEPPQTTRESEMQKNEPEKSLPIVQHSVHADSTKTSVEKDSDDILKNSSKSNITPITLKKTENERKLDEDRKQTVTSLADIFIKTKKPESAFKAKTNSPIKEKKSNQKEQLTEVQKILNEEQNELLAERGKQERLGATITQQMIIEAQELLRLFGLPYVVAPMEAEAQCAFLDQISLTEGTITDDSDIWLFGGQKVYKNFFDNRKYVLQFRAVDIEHFFKLSREQLIQMALLVGSDYTVGIEGVGPVTALEILAYFSDASNKPQTEGDIAETLRKFRLWLKNNRNNSSPLAKKCRNVTLSEAFPNTTVIEAYLYPTVDESKEGFTWATPDLDQIRTYMRAKFGWKSTRIDDILLPVMKRINEKNKQSTLDMYFRAKPFASVDIGTVSKRVIQAINVMKGKNDEEVLPTPSTSNSPKKSAVLTKTPVKKTRKTKKSVIVKKTASALPVRISSQASLLNKNAPNFGEVIPQREKDKKESAKRKLEAIKIFQAKNKRRTTKKNKVLPPKPDSSYLSESSSGDDS